MVEKNKLQCKKLERSDSETDLCPCKQFHGWIARADLINGLHAGI